VIRQCDDVELRTDRDVFRAPTDLAGGGRALKLQGLDRDGPGVTCLVVVPLLDGSHFLVHDPETALRATVRLTIARDADADEQD
jgi:hypothetical protein